MSDFERLLIRKGAKLVRSTKHKVYQIQDRRVYVCHDVKKGENKGNNSTIKWLNSL